MRHAVTQLAMAPNDAYLITTHEGDLGLYLWALKLHQVDMKLASLPIDYEPSCALTEAKMFGDDEEGDDAGSETDGAMDDDVEMAVVDKDDKVAAVAGGDCGSLMQLSGLASSYFSSMLNIENVRIRNENATKGMANSSTFFLPQIAETLDGLKWVDSEAGASVVGAEGVSETVQLQAMRDNEKKRKIDQIQAGSDIHRVDNLTTMLANAATNDDCETCFYIDLSID